MGAYIYSTTEGKQSSVTTDLSFSHTVPSGCKLLVLTYQGRSTSTAPFAYTCSYNSVSMTQLSGTVSEGDRYVMSCGIFYLLNPTPGTYTVFLQWNGSVSGVAMAQAHNIMNSNTAPIAGAVGNGSSTSPTITVSGFTAGDSILGFAMIRGSNNITANPSGAFKTIYSDSVTTSSYLLESSGSYGTQYNLTSQTLTWTTDTSEGWVAAGCAIVPTSSTRYTVSLLHMNGTDASTTFTDSEGFHTYTANGNAQIDTAQYKFGLASGLFDGTGDYLSSPDSGDWTLGADNTYPWTIDFWVRFNGITGNFGFVGQHQATTDFWGLLYNTTSSYLRFIQVDASATTIQIDNTWSPSTATWYHVAVVKDGSNGYMMFVNGTQIGTTQTDTTVIANNTGSLRVGAYTSTGGVTGYLDGWMDELRISKGVARWTSNFTPPTIQYESTATGNFFMLF